MIILGTNSIKDTGYNVDNSCRFNDDDGANMNKSYGGSTDTNFTFSAWIKRGDLGNTEALFSHWNGSNDNNRFIIYFEGDSLVAYHNSSDGSANDMYVKTTAVYRDPSAWYHFVVAIDTTQGTAANRVKIYTNGVLQTSLSQTTYPAEDYAVYAFHSSGTTYLGRNASGDSAPTKFFDGYMAEVFLIDGTTYAASNFGEYDSDSPTIWKPKDCKDDLTFGTNGTYLDFEDSGNLGDDESGNGNDLTETNIVAADQATDTCTNNFCVMNPIDNALNQATFSEGNCKLVTASSPYFYNTGTFGLSSGKFYYECKVAVSAPSNYNLIGIAGEVGGGTAGDAELGGTGTYSYGYHGNNGKYRSDVPTGSGAGYAYGATYSTSIIGVYIDLDNNKLYFSKDGVLQNSGTGISIGTSPPHGVFFPAGGEQSTSGSATLEFNFGGCPAFSISSGNSDPNGYGNFEYSTTITGDGASKSFFAINTKNLAEYGG